MLAANVKGGFSPAEALEIHRDYFDARKADFDPARLAALDAAATWPPRTMSRLARERLRLIAALDAEMTQLDRSSCRPRPCRATIAEANESDEAFFLHNGRGLRNTAFANFFDLCAPHCRCRPRPAGRPAARRRNGEDRKLLAVGRRGRGGPAT